ncbi:ATP-binding protein [Neobacillus sp. FSL H8-0543]|uniref:ATP-binding protein n=1 Tax=Neobacillus sp. FSL H8-0543 TaxID=2954672 RepID=UPI003158F739
MSLLIIPDYIGLWFLQIISILFPTVLFQSYFRKKVTNKQIQKRINSVLCGISLFICMTFPVSINEEYILDFRFIPLIIVFLYGGFRSGILLSILLITYRYAIGGIGFFLGGLWMTVFFLTVFYFTLPRVGNWDHKRQQAYPYILLTCSLIFFGLGTQFLDDYTFMFSEINLWFWFSVLNYLTLWMVMHLQNSLSEIEEMTEKVIQFEKTHTINQLLVFISQQMLAPIKTANNYLQLIEEEGLTKPQSLHLIQAKSDLIQVENSLEHYHTFMDIKANQTGEISLEKELQEIVKLMKSYSRLHEVEIIYTSTAKDDIAVKGDPSMLRFALLNIIKNGIEACSPNGHVNVYLHEMLKEVYIVIEDNGVGIAPKVLDQLGKPLTSGKVNGTGLGLASTFKITESMGGRVEVDSKPNIGTVFSVYFPKWILS